MFIIKSPYFIPLFLMALLGAVFFESTLAPSINNNVVPYLDKIAHFFTFGLIAWLMASVISHLLSPKTSSLGTHSQPGESSMRQGEAREYPLGNKSLSASFLLATIAGGLNEYIQSFTPGRLATVDDLFADMAGAAIFLLIWKVRAWKRK